MSYTYERNPPPRDPSNHFYIDSSLEALWDSRDNIALILREIATAYGSMTWRILEPLDFEPLRLAEPLMEMLLNIMLYSYKD